MPHLNRPPHNSLTVIKQRINKSPLTTVGEAANRGLRMRTPRKGRLRRDRATFRPANTGEEKANRGSR